MRQLLVTTDVTDINVTFCTFQKKLWCVLLQEKHYSYWIRCANYSWQSRRPKMWPLFGHWNLDHLASKFSKLCLHVEIINAKEASLHSKLHMEIRTSMVGDMHTSKQSFIHPSLHFCQKHSRTDNKYQGKSIKDHGKIGNYQGKSRTNQGKTRTDQGKIRNDPGTTWTDQRKTRHDHRAARKEKRKR